MKGRLAAVFRKCSVGAVVCVVFCAALAAEDSGFSAGGGAEIKQTEGRAKGGFVVSADYHFDVPLAVGLRLLLASSADNWLTLDVTATGRFYPFELSPFDITAGVFAQLGAGVVLDDHNGRGTSFLADLIAGWRIFPFYRGQWQWYDSVYVEPYVRVGYATNSGLVLGGGVQLGYQFFYRPPRYSASDDAGYDFVVSDEVAVTEMRHPHIDDIWSPAPKTMSPPPGTNPTASGGASADSATAAGKTESELPAEVRGVYVSEYILAPFFAKDFASLRHGTYYVQIAFVSEADQLEKMLEVYSVDYPMAVVPNLPPTDYTVDAIDTFHDAPDFYHVLLGPFAASAYNSVLKQFRDIGYLDAFVRKIH